MHAGDDGGVDVLIDHEPRLLARHPAHVAFELEALRHLRTSLGLALLFGLLRLLRVLEQP